MEGTIWQELKKSWIIRKRDIRDMGINPDKPWGQMTIDELTMIANHLDVMEQDILDM